MTEFMKVQYRWTVLSALLLLLFGVGVSTWRHRVDAPVNSPRERYSAPVPSAGVAPLSKQVGAREIALTAPEENSPRSARGSGYVWGKALRGVYAVSTVNPGGKRHLDLTELAKSFQKNQRPVNLEDASALPLARAEYLACVITAALDLSAGYQAQLAEILEGYYTSDWHSRELSQAEQKSECTRLIAVARDQLLNLLPAEAAERFNEVFASADFLFRSMSLGTDEITLETRGGTAVATGGVIFTVDPDGAIQFQAQEMSFQRKEKLRLRPEP